MTIGAYGGSVEMSQVLFVSMYMCVCTLKLIFMYMYLVERVYIERESC